jgi:F-type H+-transporting ATPase subunit epsilon
MHLKVLLPFQIFADKIGVSSIVAETREGSFGLLPHRLDCVAALVPGILIYQTESDGEVLWRWMKGCWSRPARTCSFPCAGRSAEPTSANCTMRSKQEFLTLDEHEQSVRLVTAKLETGFLRRFATFQHE